MKFSKNGVFEEALVVEGCRIGDRNSQQKMYKHFYGKMMVVCSRYANDNDSAKDILHDGFMKVFQKIDRYQFKGSLEGWIRRIIVNSAIDAIRKKKLHFAEFIEEQSIRGISDDSEADENDPIYSLKADEIIALIRELTPAYQAVFNLYVIDNLSHQEIAEKLGINTGTSKSNLSKARKKMQGLIKQKITAIV